MKKHTLLLAIFILVTTAGYSQMIFNFKEERLMKLKTNETNKNGTVLDIYNVVYAGEIHLKSGNVIEGNLEVKNSTVNGSINVTTFPDKQLKTIRAKDIETILVYAIDGAKPYQFIYQNYYKAPQKANGSYAEFKSKFKEKSYKWMLKEVSGKASLYSFSGGFCFRGNKLIHNKNGNSQALSFYLGQIEGRDELPVLLSYKLGITPKFQEIAPIFFEEHPVAESAKVQKPGTSIRDLFEEYNASFK